MFPGAAFAIGFESEVCRLESLQPTSASAPYANAWPHFKRVWIAIGAARGLATGCDLSRAHVAGREWGDLTAEVAEGRREEGGKAAGF